MKRKNSGFTLMEVLVTVAVLGIFMSMAIITSISLSRANRASVSSVETKTELAEIQRRIEALVEGSFGSSEYMVTVDTVNDLFSALIVKKYVNESWESYCTIYFIATSQTLIIDYDSSGSNTDASFSYDGVISIGFRQPDGANELIFCDITYQGTHDKLVYSFVLVKRLNTAA
ncbi:MAG: prepilin-type N-terminal cleavage/methylation domain-containing protein [Clostridia bacterium]|nr:prepilin-type N-terminal cleavage/methylation domain-containing protein [Clostridia bacterium]